MTLDRRRLLAGAAAALTAPRLFAADPPALLDRAAALPLEERLRLLSSADPRAMSPAERIDLAAALIGARTEAALARLSAGATGERFALQLQLQLGAAMPPKAAHARAAQEIDAITRRFDPLLQARGLWSGTVAERLRTLAADPATLYPDDDSGRDRAVADMNAWLARARARLPRAFGVIPPAAAQVAVHRMSPVDEAKARAGYRVLPGEGGVAGYFVDLHDIRRRPIWTFPAVVHHELLPGHMIQLPVEMAAAPHPLRRKAAPAFVEAWAIYAEQLALEDGAYADDPLAEIGALHWLLFRHGRSLIDTGRNALGWSRDEAIDRLSDILGFPVAFATIEGDADRAVREPGMFAAQAQQSLAIADLRHRMAHGPEQVRRFHDRLLDHGAVPAAMMPDLV